MPRHRMAFALPQLLCPCAAGAAYSTVWSSLLALLLVAAYVRWSGLQSRVWATPNGVVFQVRI